MEIIQVVSIALLGTIALVLLRQARPELAVPVSVLAGVIILFFVLEQIGAVVRLASDLLDQAGVHVRYAGSLLKIIGIAYLTEFGAQICRDAGEGAVAAKVELAGKVFILLLAVPIIVAVVETLLGVLPA
ncbi:MAG TPA: stage III sporulation protein AD [Bacillota bacterium]